MSRAWKVYDNGLDLFLALCFTIIVCVMFSAVVARYFFNWPIIWAEEISRYTFVWMVYIGAAVAARTHSHLFVDYLQGKLPQPLSRLVNTLFMLLAAAFLLYISYLSGSYALRYLSASAFTIPWFKLGWAHAAVPVGCLLMAVNTVRALLGILQRAKEG